MKIDDDSGFIGIVNANFYKSFVAEDWDLPQLFNHFIDEMNKEYLILWATGSENTWTVNFVDNPSDKESFREFDQTLEVTNGQIFLTNYEDLTMAAQYDDQQIPANHNSDLYFPVANGRHDFRIRQLFDPDIYNEKIEGGVHFEIIIRPAPSKKKNTVNSIHWVTQ